jgi:hypothetical protein
VKTKLEHVLSCLVAALVLALALCFVILREDWNGTARDYPPYTKRLLLLTERATGGDSVAAQQAWDECASTEKIDRFDTRYDTIGLCSNFLYLDIENVIALGDPLLLKGALGNLRNGGSPGFADRIQLYKNIARPYILERCHKPDAPNGCNNAEAIAWLTRVEPPGETTR